MFKSALAQIVWPEQSVIVTLFYMLTLWYFPWFLNVHFITSHKKTKLKGRNYARWIHPRAGLQPFLPCGSFSCQVKSCFAGSDLPESQRSFHFPFTTTSPDAALVALAETSTPDQAEAFAHQAWNTSYRGKSRCSWSLGSDPLRRLKQREEKKAVTSSGECTAGEVEALVYLYVVNII